MIDRSRIGANASTLFIRSEHTTILYVMSLFVPGRGIRML